MNPSLTWSTRAAQYVLVEIEVERPRNAHSLADHPVIVENDESSDTSSDQEAEDSTANPSSNGPIHDESDLGSAIMHCQLRVF